jgi:hypothetical protein
MTTGEPAHKKSAESILKEFADWEERFCSSTIYRDMFDFSIRHPKLEHWKTPRERRWFNDKTIALQTIYAIDFIANTPDCSVIYDIGCGANLFKRFYKMIIGVDPDHECADVAAAFDTDFARSHYRACDHAISVCALHFIPLKHMRERIADFASIIRPGGYGYLALNIARMIERSSADDLNQILDYDPPDVIDMGCPFIQEASIHYIDTQLHDITSELDILVARNIICDGLDNTVEGNIQLLFRA